MGGGGAGGGWGALSPHLLTPPPPTHTHTHTFSPDGAQGLREHDARGAGAAAGRRARHGGGRGVSAQRTACRSPPLALPSTPLPITTTTSCTRLVLARARAHPIAALAARAGGTRRKCFRPALWPPTLLTPAHMLLAVIGASAGRLCWGVKASLGLPIARAPCLQHAPCRSSSPPLRHALLGSTKAQRHAGPAHPTRSTCAMATTVAPGGEWVSPITSEAIVSQVRVGQRGVGGLVCGAGVTVTAAAVACPPRPCALPPPPPHAHAEHQAGRHCDWPRW